MALLNGLMISLLVGCNSEIDTDAAIAKVNETNIQRLANLYFTYQMKNNWRGPKNEEDFKGFISSYNPKKLTRIGIDPNAIDSLFINERDNQPFKIRYGVAGSAMGSSEPVIFESVGVDGKFLVGALDMSQQEVDEAQSNQLFKSRPGSARARKESYSGRR